MNFKTVRTLASAAAVLAMSTTSFSIAHAQGDPTAKVQCYGVNSCKGQSDCKSGKHDCKGQNDCKGQGFKALSASSCAAKHGTTVAPAQ